MTTRYQAVLTTTIALLLLGCEQAPAPEASQASEATPADAGLSEAEASVSAPLNLTIDREALFDLDANSDQIDTSERADLPELVGPSADKRIKVNGGVITNDEAIGLRDRVDGAEVSFELKTK